MMKADVIKALSAAQAAITAALAEANGTTEAGIPNGDVSLRTSAANVTVSSDGKVVVEPKPVSVPLTDSQRMTKSAGHSYWASAAGSTCPRCGGSGRA